MSGAQNNPTRVLLLLVLTALVGAPLRSMAQRPPHVPTEEELRQEQTGVKADPERGYQARSVETVQSWTHDAMTWVKELLQAIHLTPARLALGLGLLGSFYTLGKNKRLVRWAVMAGLSYLLAIVGICAMVFHWPYWN